MINFKKSLFILAAAASAGGFIFLKINQRPALDFVQVKRGTLIQEVSATGKIKPVKNLDLAFNATGRVAKIYVSVGQKVLAFEKLSELENGQLFAQLNQAQAALRIEETELAELRRGPKPEEIAVYQTKLASAQVGFREAEKNLGDKVKDAFSKADDAVRSRVDKLFNNPRTITPRLIFQIWDSGLEQKIILGRISMENLLVGWKEDLINSQDNLILIKSFLEDVSQAVNDSTVSPSLSSTTLDSWKTDLYTARTNINTAISNLVASEEKQNLAQAALKVAEKELLYKQAGATVEELAKQEAALASAQAGVDEIEAKIRQAMIFAPLAGLVTQIYFEVGESVAANTTVISLMSNSRFEIETKIPEVDITKVKIGDRARVALDALGSETIFEATVVKIEPAEILVEGVPTYKTILGLISVDERIKAGMTVDLEIMTAEKENVLLVPQRVVFTKNGDKFVRVLDEDSRVVETKVKTGLRSSSGQVEILDGLQEGHRVITSLK